MNRWKKIFMRMAVIAAAVILFGAGADITVQNVQAKESRAKAKKSSKKETVEVTVPDMDDSFMDNDEMFAGYVERLLYQGVDQDAELYGMVGSDRLTGDNKKIYEELKTRVEAVAAGEMTSAEFKLSKTVKLTAQEIGGVFSEDNISKAFDEKIDRRSILSYLLMDCPYDLYWFDKTDGMACRYTVSGNSESGAVLSDLTFSFTVAKEYRANNEKYEVDTSNIDMVKDAAATAWEIADSYAESSDFGKLDGYRKEICELTDYNKTAGSSQTEYGNPWQLIWVFDQDPSTDVMCEGYAKAFQYLCDLTEFSSGETACYTVSGTVDSGTGEEPHMWNVVTMEDGKNYLVDITNCDTGSAGAPNKLFLAGASSGGVVEGYTFDLGSAQTLTYKYASDPDQNRLLGDGVLTLSRSKYVKKETPKITLMDRSVEVTFADSPEVFDFFQKGIRAENKEGYRVPGIFSWEEAVMSNGYGAAGEHTYQVVFIPEDTDTYLPADASVKVIVNPRKITPELTIDPKSYVYTGEQIIPAISLKYGELEIDAEDYTVKYSDNINVGTCTVTVSQKEEGNLEWEELEDSFTIEKADYPGEKEKELSVKFGTSDQYDLGDMLPPDYKTGELSVTDNRGIFEEAPVLKRTILSYTAVGDENKIGRRATVVIPVSAKNYKDFEIRFVITVRAKLNQEDFGFAKETVSKTYGDPDFTVTADGAEDNSEVTYSSSDEKVASVDPNGLVHILRSGSSVITAYASETEEYLQGDASYVLNVEPKALEWDTGSLYAVDREDRIPEDKSASLYGELRAAGFVNAEDAVFECPAEKLSGLYKSTDPGTPKVELSWRKEPVALQGDKAGCYLLPDTLPVLTGKINAVSEIEWMPPEAEENVKYKLEIEEGISMVPDTYMDKEELDTPAKIEDELKKKIREKDSGIDKENIIIYDVALMLDTGNGWEEASPDNFPQDGLTVELPYPEGTGERAQDFTICHLFTQEVNGHAPGETEYPATEKTAESIRFKVQGLSPVGVGWSNTKIDSQVSQQAPSDQKSAGNAGGESGSGQGKGGVKTGDRSHALLYVALLILSALGIRFYRLIWGM